MKKETRHLGELLIGESKITPGQLDEALSIQQKTGERLGHTLINLGYISENELIKTLEKQFGIPCIKINNKMINRQIVKQIPESICRKYRIIPILLINDRLTVAATNPFDMNFIDEIKFSTAYNVDVALCSEKSVIEAIGQSFGQQSVNARKQAAIEVDEKEKKGLPIPRIIEFIVTQAENHLAKEVHLEYTTNRLNVVYITQNKILMGDPPPLKLYRDISSRIKTMASLDPYERVFQEGLFRIKISGKEKLVRVLIFPTQLGENIFMRFA